MREGRGVGRLQVGREKGKEGKGSKGEYPACTHTASKIHPDTNPLRTALSVPKFARALSYIIFCSSVVGEKKPTLSPT